MAHPTPDPVAAKESHALAAEHHGSWAPLIVASSVIFLVLGVLWPIPVLPIGLLILFIGLGWWIKEDVNRFHHVARTPHGDPRPGPWWGMVLFIGTEVLIFASLFAVWFVGKHHAGVTWGEAVELPITATAINTAILVASGGTLHWGMLRLKQGHYKGFLLGMTLTLVLGAIFLAQQAREYLELVQHEEFTIKSGLFGSAFYMLTGTHGAHVFGGLVFLAVVLFRAAKKTQTKDHHVALEAAAFYWHFVDVVWIFLFGVVYLRLI